MSSQIPNLPIFLIDDEPQILFSYDTALRFGGYNNIVSCNDSRDALAMLNVSGAEMIILDLSMPHMGGDELLVSIRQHFPEIPVVIATGNDGVESAVECIKHGAFDYMVKPIDDNRLLATVGRARSFAELARENMRLKDQILSEELEAPEGFSEIITQNRKMVSLLRYVESIAGSAHPVLVTGDTGVGKELMARAIHKASKRTGSFVCVNIGGLDDTLFTDTLFGHRKGAFTGADTDRRGLIEEAAGGTLFLDEIGDMSMQSQIKLLRLLQEKEYFALGEDTPRKSDVRIVVATNLNLEKVIADGGNFRNDLFYRLHTHRIHIPPMCERIDDLPLLVEHLVKLAAEELERPQPTIPRDLIDLLSRYDFPGNIRELQGMLVDAVSTGEPGKLSMTGFRERITGKKRSDTAVIGRGGFMGFGKNMPTMNEIKDMVIEEALNRSEGNKTLAAEMLGISRQAINKRERKKQ